MNFYNFQSQAIDSSLARSVYQILNAQHYIDPLYFSQKKSISFIKIKERSNTNEEYVYNTKQVQFCQLDNGINKLNDLCSTLNLYCNCDSQQFDKTCLEKKTEDELDLHNIDTYKELKEVAMKSNPDITKEEIYELLLKPYQHKKMKLWDEVNNRFRVSYICKYQGCNKEFTKTWNLLDHVRMHEGKIYFKAKFEKYYIIYLTEDECRKSFSVKRISYHINKIFLLI